MTAHPPTESDSVIAHATLFVSSLDVEIVACCAFALQVSANATVLATILAASRALFECAPSEGQMLVCSLPTAYL
jgi:hypothetical protein